MKRTHRCTEITENMIGEKVTVMGWVNKRRNLGQLIFITLRDVTGLLQLVVNEGEKAELAAYAKEIKTEYVIEAIGIVRSRGTDVNKEMKTGAIEIEVESLNIISAAEQTPFTNADEGVSEDLRLKYRYLDLRREKMQYNLITRHKTTMAIRNFLDKENFLEIETPFLTKSTPEGARDYILPSRVNPGNFYALPQSPQLFKQLFMVAGLDKYFQIVRCFRDEDLRADRQPEFTQVDIELSFVDKEDIINLGESLIKEVWKNVMSLSLDTPFPRMTFEEAMERFGSDKPDTRFELELINITETTHNTDFEIFKNAQRVGAINAKGLASYNRKKIDKLIDHAKDHKAKTLSYISFGDEIKTSLGKVLTEDEIQGILKACNAEQGDLVLICADLEDIVLESLGAVRLKIGNDEGLIDKTKFNFLWVTEFPLLEYSEEDGRFFARHHPFTRMMDEDKELLKINPKKVRAYAYDLVLNGFELGGGSIRITDPTMQEEMFAILGFSKEETYEQFGFLLEAYKYGAPPHGGIALGLDRIAMLMTNSDSIREVIAFPKVKDASCPLTNAPSEVSAEQLKELKITKA
ncbi:MAG: aspartate--tRNA ligase [Defluviitaleaceae bacterium]|nr:aspartate--tRNA ligase [Defluviitaleaceae bacterium]